MKKSGILHAELSRVVAAMGHTDLLVIGDAGLPVPPGVPCIDLAVTAGLPAFLPVVEAVATELEVQRLTVATELENNNRVLAGRIRACFPSAAADAIPHAELKALSARARAVVRTGETTPYANVVLGAGVTF
jgi:D-ribose pyranase